jgi:two-component system, OmpR family, heavy metal sensor histidine kinase CusS
MKRLSIGFRLTLWYLAIFALGEFVFGAGMWFILRGNLLDIVDDSLESQVEDLKTFLNTQAKDASLAKLQEDVKGTYGIEHSGDFLELYTEGGDLIYRSPFLQAHPKMLMPVNQVGEPTYRIRHAERQHFRFLYQKLSVNGRNYIVEMGTTADDAIDTLHLFRDYLLLFAAALLLVSGFVGYWISRRALSPVDALVKTARSIRGTNLSGRLQKVETGDELQRLSDTLNEMLDRIELAFQRITQFTADASHELRTPVSLIRTEAELALRRSRSEGEYKESLGHILFEAERTTNLIEQLLELARADSGREVLDIQPVDLSQTLRSIVDRWQQVSSIRNLEFAAKIGDQPAFVMGDETLLRRLTEILLDNAFKYTPSPGSVRLSLEQNTDRACITVQDSGAGIAREDQSKIFERFYRIDKARSRAQGGTGLGLAIAQWIVSQHRGTITVESRAGEGATFRVDLPLTPAPVRAAQAV